MTFTYSGPNSDGEKVRLMIGDTDSANALLTDEEITYFITLGGTIYAGAVLAARAVASKFSRLADTQIESVSVSNSQKAKQYFALADQLEKQGATLSGTGGGPSATGISIAGMISAENNTDRPPSAFKQGMFSDPQTRNVTDDDQWR